MICNTKKIKDVSVVSPFGRRWQVHVKLLANKDNKKRFKKVLYLHLATKCWKVSQISKCILGSKVRVKPYYIAKQEYIKMQVALTRSRAISKDFKSMLFIKQEGICTECSLPLDLYVFSQNETTRLEYYDSSQIEIHHVKPIAEGNRLGGKIHKEYNDFNNLVLLHKDCHYNITYNHS
jgi:5-methylcytosine-specific restriction endonuclease McrA